MGENELVPRPVLAALKTHAAKHADECPFELDIKSCEAFAAATTSFAINISKSIRDDCNQLGDQKSLVMGQYTEMTSRVLIAYIIELTEALRAKYEAPRIIPKKTT